MAEIMKTASDLGLMDNFDPVVCSLEEISKMKMQQQETNGELLTTYIGSGMQWSAFILPPLQFNFGDTNSLHQAEYCSIRNDQRQGGLESVDSLSLSAGGNTGSTETPVLQVSGTRDPSLAVQSVVSKGMAQDSTSIEAAMQAMDADNQMLEMQVDADIELRKDSRTLNTTTTEKNLSGTGETDFVLMGNENTGESQETVPAQRQEFLMEQPYELPPELSAEALDSMAPVETLGGSKLTYNFKQWGEGHSVNVKLRNQDEETLLQFEPSDGLVEQRLGEQWEIADVPANWSLLEKDSDSHQQRQGQQPESDEEDSE